MGNSTNHPTRHQFNIELSAKDGPLMKEAAYQERLRVAKEENIQLKQEAKNRNKTITKLNAQIESYLNKMGLTLEVLHKSSI